ncbi:uncharacterized protein Gasu_23890 [Galdieria sulphuraria]|uniref:Uncharacterized protein n=1 Tax=Galdieria sulphuraria TaxID=130081 RepID=M2Y339_GALSU|nr:uncharacterized protein Gasu_23890 [Galdieria sulphuraria]EME30234.1 hypothetical protein Gasu_23890 [Galdieria sulphuraria]|eukprot:XP_005706754.1 hypothetical protein Gasu_23890 [Galdieria sulphuraria]
MLKSRFKLYRLRHIITSRGAQIFLRKKKFSTILPKDSIRLYLFSNRKFVINCVEQTEVWESVLARAGV